MSYSNRVNRSFLIILLFFSLSLLSLLVSVFLIFFSPLSLLLFSFSLTPHSLSASMGLINLFIGLFFSTCFNGSNQPLLFSFTLYWSSSLVSTSAWMGLINLHSNQPWVSAWMGLGFGLIWVSAPINHENEKLKNHKAWVWEIWVSAWWWLGDDDDGWVWERERERPWVRK